VVAGKVLTHNCDTGKLFCINSMLKHCAANRKRRLCVLPNVGPYIYTTLKFLALQGAPYIYDISRLRVKAPVKDGNGIAFYYTFMGQQSCTRSTVDRNVVMRYMTVHDHNTEHNDINTISLFYKLYYTMT
jgi:hypothetical protein